VGVQIEVELAVGVVVGQAVGQADGERGLAHACHAVDREDAQGRDRTPCRAPACFAVDLVARLAIH